MAQGAYLTLHEQETLVERIIEAEKRLSSCRVCPRGCKVDRLSDERGVCQTGAKAVVSSYAAHFGEESPLVGSCGSGTIFFTHCNLLCLFCQNFEISHLGQGLETDAGQLASMMIRLYNSSGYDSPETLKLLEGVIDIYMPDFKFWSRESAKRYANAPDYPEVAREAVAEMHRQVGDLELDNDGIAVKGLLVRHLVMPGGLDETGEIMRFLARKVSKNTYVNVMDQYRPCGTAYNCPPINRRLSSDEYRKALGLARDAGLKRLDEKDWLRIVKKLLG